MHRVLRLPEQLVRAVERRVGVGERLELVGQPCLLDRRQGELDRFARAPLLPPDLAAQRAEHRACGDGGRLDPTLDEGEPRRCLAQSSGVGAGAHPGAGAAGVDPRLLDGIVREQDRRPAQRVERLVEQAGRLAHRAQGDEHLGPVAAADRAHTAPGSEGELVESRRLDVRSHGTCAVAADPRVVPRPVVAPRRRIVQRERRRLVVDRGRRRLDRLGDARVQFPAPPERKALVGGVVDERVAEAQPAVRVAVDEAPEARPQAGVGGHLVAECRGQQDLVERDAEHGRVPQHDPVGGREPVDVRGHDRLDRVGQRLDRPVRARDVQQLDEEERASPGPAHDLLDLVRAQRLLVGGELDQLGGVVRGERQERAGEAALAFLLLVVHQPDRRVACLVDEQRVRHRAGGAGEPAQQVGARVVHELSVLDYERHRRRLEGGDEEPQRRLRQHLVQEALVDRGRLRRRRQVEPEQDPEQRDPGDEPGIGPLDHLPQPAFRCVRIGCRARGRAPRASAGGGRSTASRTRTPRSRRTEPAGAGAAASSSPTSRDLPMPDGPAIDTVQPCPAATSASTAVRVSSSCSRPTNGVSAILSSRRPAIGPTSAARTGSAFPFAWNGSIGVVENVVRERCSTSSVARIWPASARAITRAAVLIASPRTAYVRR